MRLGMVQLGLRPDVFWDLTPAELFLLAGVTNGGSAALDRAGFEALLARFPDRTPAEEPTTERKNVGLR
jgi:uncharacterized phage protein (TIGR02216 family)